jgi:glutamyl-tRNA synthetase
MTVRVRIAPSPTGNLHIGTARTALFNWLYARRHGGKFILRIEDTDRERSRDEYTQNILNGLAWLGIDFDEGPFYQTQRLEHYKVAIHKLLDRGLAYFCYASAEELEQMRAEQKAKKQAPRYDNRHRNLTREQQAAYIAAGRKPVVRFKIEEPREVTWHDMVRGEVTWNTRDLGGDMVIARTDEQGQVSLPLYNFAVVVDDIEMDITHVIRGEDHIANTAKQILLYEVLNEALNEALSANMPKFAHLPLILNKDGAKISKRDGATSVDEFRAMGYVPEAFNNYMVLLGWSTPDAQDIFAMQDAAPIFGFDRVNKAGARFDWDKLNWLNSQYLHTMPIEDLCDRLIPFWREAGFDRELDFVAKRPWLLELTALIAPSLTRLTDAVEMTRFLFESELKYTDGAIAALQPEAVKPVITALLEELQNIPELTADTANNLIQTVTKSQNVKKGMVMKPLRCALTGDVHGPELIPSFLLLHQRNLTVPRLQQALSLS